MSQADMREYRIWEVENNLKTITFLTIEEREKLLDLLASKYIFDPKAEEYVGYNNNGEMLNAMEV